MSAHTIVAEFVLLQLFWFEHAGKLGRRDGAGPRRGSDATRLLTSIALYALVITDPTLATHDHQTHEQCQRRTPSSSQTLNGLLRKQLLLARSKVVDRAPRGAT